MKYIISDCFELFIAILVFGLLSSVLHILITNYKERKESSQEEYKKGLINLENHKS